MAAPPIDFNGLIESINAMSFGGAVSPVQQTIYSQLSLDDLPGAARAMGRMYLTAATGHSGIHNVAPHTEMSVPTVQTDYYWARIRSSDSYPLVLIAERLHGRRR